MNVVVLLNVRFSTSQYSSSVSLATENAITANKKLVIAPRAYSAKSLPLRKTLARISAQMVS